MHKALHELSDAELKARIQQQESRMSTRPAPQSAACSTVQQEAAKLLRVGAITRKEFQELVGSDDQFREVAMSTCTCKACGLVLPMEELISHSCPLPESMDNVKENEAAAVAAFDDIMQPSPVPIHGGTHKRYKCIGVLGRGSFGVVYKAADRWTGQLVAIKKIAGALASRTDAKFLLRELSILKQCDHPAIVGLLNILQPTDSYHLVRDVSLVFPYYEMNLAQLIESATSRSDWSLLHVKYLLYQMVCGVDYLHSAGILHRDLKPSNMLVNLRCELKVCDFGLSRVDPRRSRAQTNTEDQTQQMPQRRNINPLTGHVVTRWYRAPELILMMPEYNTPIDIWSIGCILGELLQTLQPGRAVQPLFPGSASAMSDRVSDEFECWEDRQEQLLCKELGKSGYQLTKIFDVIGTPSSVEIDRFSATFAGKVNAAQHNVSAPAAGGAAQGGEAHGSAEANMVGGHAGKGQQVVANAGRPPRVRGLMCTNKSSQKQLQQHEQHAAAQRRQQEQRSRVKKAQKTQLTARGRAAERVHQTLSNMQPRPPRNLEEMFPAASSDMLYLLQSMLEFNPADRMDAKHVIASPCLQSIQDSWIVNNGYSLADVASREMNFDFEYQRNANLKELVFTEMQSYSSPDGDANPVQFAASSVELKPREGATSL
jgi:serine/threonine protein kinase